jgi:hypothetical protein
MDESVYTYLSVSQVSCNQIPSRQTNSIHSNKGEITKITSEETIWKEEE